MPQEVSPKQVQEQVQTGFKRFHNFRSARLMFLKSYAGQYYDRTSGEIGTEPLNLIFNAIRVLVPHIVMNFPRHNVETQFMAYRDYADLLSLALNDHDKKSNIRDVYRRVIVDAIFTLGIMKTGICQSDSVYAIDGQTQIDAGSIYTEAVDFDNFVVDPRSTDHMFRDAQWMGDRLCVPRSKLLDSGLYKNDLIERLPGASDDKKISRAKELSMRNVDEEDVYDDEDYVEIVEIHVPGANALITVPGDDDVLFDDFLRVDDYYGPKQGPYTLLAMTPPMPGNPLPIPAVGVWYDLAILGNRMAKKIVDQAQRQKDITAYKRSAADDAEELRNAGDGEAVAVDDPDAVKVLSFGGQQNSNEVHLAQLQNWFNQMSGDPQQQQLDARSATSAQNLQSISSLGLEDMKDMVYEAAKRESAKRAWYLHTDPMINLPLTRRQAMPPQYIMGMTGPILVQPAQMVEQQVILTPEARRGDFMAFAFNIEPESMGRVDSKVRFAQALDFATKIMPAVMTSAQVSATLGLPFSPKAFILRMAKDAGITWMDEVFYDPEFQMQLQMQTMMGPQPQQAKGEAGPPKQQPNSMIDQIAQNGQPANLSGPQMNQQQQFNSNAQQGAQFAQREIGRLANRGITSPDPLSSLSY